jgi:hypothetical protein
MKFEPNAEYKLMLPKWSRCRDCAAGQDAVRKAGETYLPRPSKYWEADEYKSYLMGADFFNAYGKTVDTLTGLIFKNDPQIETPPGMESLRMDATLTGIPLVKYARRVTEEVLITGRCGTLVDYPQIDPGEGLSVADVEAMNLRPRFSLYPAESIWDWKQEWVNNSYVTTYVVLAEGKSRVRELLLISGVYVVKIWELEEKSEQYYLSTETIPIMNGRPLEFIPFLISDPIDGTWDMDQPPLLDLADMNLSHYRTMATLEWGRAKTALPTFWATGVEPEDLTNGVKGVPIRLGSGNGLMTSKDNARFGLLEFTGQGLGALERADTQKREMMAALGSSVLIGDNPAESGIAAMVRREGEGSGLASIAWSISETLTKALGIAREWYGVQGDVGIRLNTEYYKTPANPQELMALFAQVQAGTLSTRSLWEYMQKTGVLPREKTFEQNQEELEEDTAGIMGALEG